MRQYTLRVYPQGQSRIAHRVIVISGEDTLDRLCDMILSSFDFSRDHLYEFSMSGKLYSDDNYTCDPEYDGQPTTNVKLDKLGLQKGQKFILHYDFGDDWVFQIRVQAVQDEEARTLAHVTDAKGSVEQYPDDEWDDEWDDEDDDLFDEEPEEFIKARAENKVFMDLFLKDLTSAGLSQKTIQNHMDNVDFYLTDYLPYVDEEDTDMAGGAETSNLRDFFADYYIYKCAWSTPGNLKKTAASIKKFYKCMADHDKISQDQYKNLCALFKEKMADWQEECRKFNEDDGGDFMW
ncbi:MAG: hypothetical protein ACI4W2_00975 [Eubacterium sp.]